MACINEKGKLTESAKKLLQVIEKDALPPQIISKKTKIPLFKVRSSLRDMKSMGFVSEADGLFQMNPKTKKLFDKN